MASAWIERRRTASDGLRYRVRFRLGGRESNARYAGSFRTQREARLRCDWVRGELAALRVPKIELLEPQRAATFAVYAGRWRASRVDVADGTAAAHRVNIGRLLPMFGDRPVDELTAADVSDWVAAMHDHGLARESLRKTKATLAMVLDFAGVIPNPARDPSVKLPREDRREVAPPLAAHVEAVHRLLSPSYRLPLLVLDSTGMRVGELEALSWGDLDVLERRWRVSQAVAKTRQARWVPVAPTVFDAVDELLPREDRLLHAQVFDGFSADTFRTRLQRACKAAGVPLFSPHDLRHRRATLWHLSGVPAVEAAAWLGHSPTEHLKTYAHATLGDRSELDYDRLVLTSVHTRRSEVAA